MRPRVSDAIDRAERSHMNGRPRSKKSPKQGQKKSVGETPPEPPPEWGEPVPLKSEIPPPAFPVEYLPDWLRKWVEETAEALQVAVDLPAMLALAILAAGLAGRFAVTPRLGWEEPLNLFVVATLLPGERKSQAFARAIHPVQELEREQSAGLREFVAESESVHRVLQGRLKNAESRASKAKSEGERREAMDEASMIARELATHKIIASPQFYCDDATPEELCRLLAIHDGRMLQASAEGTLFEIAKGRYSESANFDCYLKGHAGDPLRVGRVGRGSDHVDSPALSVAVTIQPDVLRGLADEASMRGRGFLARFMYAVPESRVGSRRARTTPVGDDVEEEYSRQVKRIWQLGCDAGDDAEGNVSLLLHFTDEADAALEQFETWLEPQLHPDAELAHLAGWANKLAGAIARIAGVLHVASGGDQKRDVSKETVEAAIRIGRDYLLPHAQAAFGMMASDEKLAKACRLWRSISERCASSAYSAHKAIIFSRRDLFNWNRRPFERVELMDPIIDVLIDHEFLRLVPEQGAGSGRGKKSPRYEVNPRALELFSFSTP